MHLQLSLPRNLAKPLRLALRKERQPLRLVLHLHRATPGNPSLRLALLQSTEVSCSSLRRRLQLAVRGCPSLLPKGLSVQLYKETEQQMLASTSPGHASPAWSV